MLLVINVGYIIASFIAIFITTLIVYKVANNIFGLGLRLKPILLCAVCAMLISLVLPKIIVGFAGLPATLAVLAVFAVVFAYFVARYEDIPLPHQDTDAEADSTCCLEATLWETEVAENKLNKGQFTLQEESLNDTRVASVDEESDIVQADNYNIAVDTRGSLEDNPPENQQIDAAESVSFKLPESAYVKETQEADSPLETEVVENELVEVIQEVNSNVIDPQIALTSADSSAGSEAISLELPTESDNVETVGSYLDAETVDNELYDQENMVEANEAVSTDIALDITELDNNALCVENSNVMEADIIERQLLHRQEGLEESQLAAEIADEGTEFTKGIEVEDSSAEESEMKDINEASGQVAAEVLLQMPNKVIAGQAESPVDQAFMQEVDDVRMEYEELNASSVQMEAVELDDLIDFAFVCKETQDYNNAYKSFKKALTLYPNSEAAPFLVVEIGNILKNKGNYDEAIKIFSEGRNLSQTKHDEMMEQEFISTIAYLRITKNILLQNRLGNIPFFEIPTQILNQIDEEFREWRNVGNI